ncbi:hypothetical protein [Helicobacter labetoulli]|uniref:hypothetical protein n=1 Tax=Helicobacter labetoulli TaxID=2315333 RepID=UPI000EF67A10|nr:hypothetical protein [Helicobacter labetoulli]
MARANKRRIESLIGQVSKEKSHRRFSVFKDTLLLPMEVYGALKYLVGEIGWSALLDTKEAKSFMRLIVEFADELKARKKIESFCGVTRRAEAKEAEVKEPAPKEKVSQGAGEHKEQGVKNGE